MLESIKEIKEITMSLIDIAKKSKDVLRPYGELDVLLFYGLVAQKMKKFLKDKELAAKNWIPGFRYIIKRGSKQSPLFVDEFVKNITPKFLEIRSKDKELKKARPKLNKIQQNIWNYFIPRKLSDFFYATNSEGPGKGIDRIFFDIDRKEISAEKTQKITREFIDIILKDKEVKKYIRGKPFVAWTGNSFHVYLMLKKKQSHFFYLKNSQFTKETYRKKKEKLTFTEKWIRELQKRTKVKLIGGHEKIKKEINIDPSQTPSGKLCRVPLGSLHMKDAKNVNGISIPLTLNMLKKKNLIKELRAYTPKKVLKDLNKLAKRIP